MGELTQVELEWVKGRIENWIRFGCAAEQGVLDSQRRIVSFAPGSIFAFIRWASNGYGTILSRIDILRAVVPGELYSTLPHVRPAVRACCTYPAGGRLRRCFTRSTPSRRWGLIPRTLRPITGVTFTTGFPWGNSQDRTAATGIRPGSTGESSRDDGPHRHISLDGGRDCAGSSHHRSEGRPAPRLERIRKCPDGSLSRAASVPARCH